MHPSTTSSSSGPAGPAAPSCRRQATAAPLSGLLALLARRCVALLRRPARPDGVRELDSRMLRDIGLGGDALSRPELGGMARDGQYHP